MLASQIIKSVQKAVSDFADKKVTLKDLKLKEKVLKVIERNQNTQCRDVACNVSIKKQPSSLENPSWHYH